LLSPEDYSRAGALIKDGELVVFPTETVYGLGASAVNSRAVERVYHAKERPRDNPLIIHFGTQDEMLHAIPPEEGLLRRAVEYFSPGPLTVIVPAPSWAVPEVRHNLPTIAIRMPAASLAQKIICAAAVPVAAPSANRSGRPSPTTATMAYQEMDRRVAAVVDGGDCTVGIESTIIRAERDRELVVLRPGSISTSDLARVLDCPVHHQKRAFDETDDPVVPGTRYRHYQPSLPVILVPREAMHDALAELAFLKQESSCTVLTEEQLGSYQHYAEELYRSFWRAERSGKRIILAELPPPEIAEGLADRLQRAATGIYHTGLLSGLLSIG
jgi:L-threonylcarbamoyladenylate synthase